ncbi:MAG: site-specific DNA-methyltransferase [Planctomycetes bacterium]|nr:site-specific DNA-methyltransferase [Planctomycetota bacterium]
MKPSPRPALKLFATTLWEYPSQHFDAVDKDGFRVTMQGDKDYMGATPSWVLWQLLNRYTREGDSVLDPMCGSGTTIDVCNLLKRKPVAFDLAPFREDIVQADARKLPLEDSSVDFAFVDPPYSTHVNYSEDPRCIGKLDAGDESGGRDYYAAMKLVLRQMHRILRNRRYMAIYVSDSWRKRRGEKGKGGGIFMPIGFELFAQMRELFQPVDIICVARKNSKLESGEFRRAAEDGNFFLRGFNYLMIGKKVDDEAPTARKPKP